MSGFSHLDDDVAALASSDDATRSQAAVCRLFLRTPVINRLLDKLERHLYLPKAAMSANVLIVGSSGAGKTSLLNHFLSQHPPRETKDVTLKEVVALDAPAVPDMGALANALLEAIGYASEKGPIERRFRLIHHRLALVQARYIVMDEVQHGLQLGSQTQRHFLAALKSLENRGNIRIVAFGTKEALALFSRDPQVMRRFDFELLPEWKYDSEFLRLLVSFERRLPLRKTSGLASAELSELLYRKSKGNMARLAYCLGRAAQIAIESGDECITTKTVKNIKLHTVADERYQSA